jgi:phospholipid/cholesterol/gamma-HCH transport system substrate-binding protein
MKPFRERNPLAVGAAGLIALGAGVVVALNAQNLPLIGGGTGYAAAFTEAAGLRAGEHVTIAGVVVGKVTGVGLQGSHVRVDFRVNDGVRFGRYSRAAIEIETLLGSHDLALDPAGPGQFPAGGEIPVSRTSTPYQVVPAIGALTKKVEQVNVRQLARAFDTLSATFASSPPEVRASLSGLSRLSAVIASRDEQLRELLAHTRNVSALLASHAAEINQIINDGDLVLREVASRREVIHQLLINTVVLAEQVSGLINDNQAKLGPLLTHLKGVEEVLLRNQGNLDRALRLLGPFAREFADATGNGRWLDGWVQNLLPVPAQLMPAGGGGGSWLKWLRSMIVDTFPQNLRKSVHDHETRRRVRA